MALSEGLKGLMNFIAGGFTQDDPDRDVFTEFDGNGIDDVYQDNTDGTLALDSMYKTEVKPARSFERESKVTTHPNSYKSGEVTVIEPRSFSESTQIVRKLLDKKTVVLHLDLLDKEQSQRTIDFVCGAAHALDGKPQKVGDLVFVFTPSNVTLSVDVTTKQNKFDDSLWRSPAIQ